jgi:hypothetical protein
VRYGHTVDAGGGNTYMDKPNNIDIPPYFLAGGRNRLNFSEGVHHAPRNATITWHSFKNHAQIVIRIAEQARQKALRHRFNRPTALYRGCAR